MLNITDTSRDFFMPEKWVNRKIKVALVGVGGTGSAMLTELFQMNGILKNLGSEGFDVTVFDGDQVSQSNIFRQNFWAHDVGLNKAKVLVDRFNQFGGINWKSKPEFFTAKSTRTENFDLLITAVDKASVRYEIGKALSDSYKTGLWLDLGNDETQANVLLGNLSGGEPKNKNRLPTPFELFGEQWALASKTENDTPSCSTEEAIQKQTFGINGMTARSAASMILFPLLRFGKIKHHGLFIDLYEADISKMAINPVQWGLYGYQEQQEEDTIKNNS